MRLSTLILIVGFLFTSLSNAAAQVQPLKVGVSSFLPPFVMQAANNQLYGFDISMMENICKRLNRPCHFITMHFRDLIPAVESKKVDVAVSSITITPERAVRISFSIPYLISQARFLGHKSLAAQPFRLEMLNDKSIGVEEGSVFANKIKAMVIKNPKIIEYNEESDMLTALRDHQIDIALMDNFTAKYWEIGSSGNLIAIGPPFKYGFGVAIAVDKEQLDLLNQINQALLQYQNSPDFKKNYDKYLKQF